MKLYTHHFKAMGGPCTLSFYASSPKLAEKVKALAEKEALRFEFKYSRYREDSLIAKINRGEQVLLDHETLQLINYADAAYQASEGLFDITSGIYRTIWDFKKNDVPSSKQIAEVASRVGWEKVLRVNDTLQLLEGMELDLGGIVKEYAADAIRTLMEKQGITRGVIELAGDIVVQGPHPDGSPWQIGIRHPDTGIAAATLAMKKGALASSGDYERFFVKDGTRYCHIINPKTGYPCDGVASVTVIAPLCVMAGTLSTVAMLNNQSGAKAFLDQTDLDYLLFYRNGDKAELVVQGSAQTVN